MRHLDLFSGIGGFALAADWVWPDAEHVFCEIEPFAQAVLRKHWPNAPIYEDIKELAGTNFGAIDLLTGGFPCQPFSDAGLKRGKDDDRDLWPEMFRVIKETRPTWIVGENVAGFVKMELDRSVSDLESEGYAVQAFDIPAIAVDARHIRHRIWIVAHAAGERERPVSVEREPDQESPDARGRGADMANTDCFQPERRRERGKLGEAETGESCEGIQRQRTGNASRNSGKDLADADSRDAQGVFQRSDGPQERQEQEIRPARLRRGGREHCRWTPEPKVGRVAHGVPRRVDRIKALGNAIVPHVAFEIMQTIRATELVN